MGEGEGEGGQKELTPHLNPPPQGGRSFFDIFYERRK